MVGMIRLEQVRVWETVVDRMYAGTLRDTGCYKGSQAGGHDHVVSVKDTAFLRRFV